MKPSLRWCQWRNLAATAALSDLWCLRYQNIPDLTDDWSEPWHVRYQHPNADLQTENAQEKFIFTHGQGRKEQQSSCEAGRRGGISTELWPKDSSTELQWSISWFVILTVGNNVLIRSWVSNLNFHPFDLAVSLSANSGLSPPPPSLSGSKTSYVLNRIFGALQVL